MIGANLGIIRRERWPLAARLSATLGPSIVGYAVLVGAVILVWPRRHPLATPHERRAVRGPAAAVGGSPPSNGARPGWQTVRGGQSENTTAAD